MSSALREPPPKPTPLTGFKKFAVALAVVLMGIGTFFGILMVVVYMSMLFSDRANRETFVIGLAALLPVTAAAGWGCWRLNRLLQRGRKPKRKGNPFTCAVCLDEAPTIRAGLNRHIGMIVLMSHRSIKGRFCKKCFLSTFWPYTGVTLFFGWWGMISLILTPIVLVNNIVMLIRSFGLPAKPADAKRPILQPEEVRALETMRQELTERLAAGDDEEDISRDFSERTGFTPGQVFLFVDHISHSPVVPPPVLSLRPVANPV